MSLCPFMYFVALSMTRSKHARGGPEERRTGEGVVDERNQTVLGGETGHRLEIGHLDQRVRERLHIDQPRAGCEGGGPRIRILGINAGVVDAEAGEVVGEQVRRTPVHHVLDQQVIAGAEESQKRRRNGPPCRSRSRERPPRLRGRRSGDGERRGSGCSTGGGSRRRGSLTVVLEVRGGEHRGGDRAERAGEEGAFVDRPGCRGRWTGLVGGHRGPQEGGSAGAGRSSPGTAAS